MLSDVSLNPLNILEAKIQTRIAKFLLAKETLLNLSKNQSLSIRSKAKELYSIQTILENKLNNVLNKIDVLKKGSWTFSDIAEISSFYLSMDRHISNVNKLSDEANKTISVKDPKEALSYLKWLFIIGTGLSFMSLFRRR
ncbi:MAG TPA: hypothetical protein ENG87_03635 [Candidatus Pacearchaeota archaeon]|nr:hypothetical protein [Candidatus Pacearchaeota archaeon]